LENQIDAKLVQLSKLGTSLKVSPSLTPGFGVTDKTPLMADDDDDDDDGDSGNAAACRSKALCDDISALLTRLAAVNDGLTDWAVHSAGGGGGSPGATPSPAIHHTLQRHKDILQDYQQEFNKTKSNVLAAIERHDLLDSVHKDISDYNRKTSAAAKGGPADGNRRMEMLLKESEHARNSERLIDEHISIAVEAREALVNQRLAFKAIQTKLNDISNKFPMINNLVQKINLRKRRDSIVLGAVIGLCVTFILWYSFG